MDGVVRCHANMISVSPLVPDPHEAERVAVRLSSLPEAGQGRSQKEINVVSVLFSIHFFSFLTLMHASHYSF